MQDLDLIATFTKVAENGNFSAAARDLRITLSAVSRQIARLENNLGVQLFARTTRSLRMTEAGEQFYEYCLRGLTELEHGVALVSRLRREPQGLLRVSATPFFGKAHLVPAILPFIAKYPQVSVDLSLRHSETSFHESGVDILVRAGRVTGRSLTSQDLAPMVHIICASPEYLKKHGVPKHPKDLIQHNCLRSTRPMPVYEWPFVRGRRKEYVPVSGNFCADSVEALHTAAINGVGIARLPNYVVGPELRSGKLIAIFPRTDAQGSGSYETTVNTMKAYYLRERHPNPKIQAFIKFLRSYFGEQYDWERRDSSTSV